MDKLEITYLIQRDLDMHNREQRYRQSVNEMAQQSPPSIPVPQDDGGGDEFECPECGQASAVFAAWPPGPGEVLQCPHCNTIFEGTNKTMDELRMDYWDRQHGRDPLEQLWSDSATSEDTEAIVEGDKSGFLRDPHARLYPCAWEGEKMRADAKKIIKNHVLNAIELEFQQPDQFIYFTVYGSGASYNWDEDGDFDVQMWVDIDKFNELHEDDHNLSQDDLVADIRRIIGPINFLTFKDLNLTSDDEDGGTGEMMIQFYAKPGTGSKSENLSQKPYACYDMETDEWYVRPKPIRPQFYGDAFLLVEPKAHDVAIQSESALDELQRNITDWQFWYAMWKKYKNHAYKARFEEARDEAEQMQETIKVLFEGVFGGRQEAYSEEGKGIEDERDILQKQLEVWGIFQRLKHWSRQPLPWTEQEMPKDSAINNPANPFDPYGTGYECPKCGSTNTEDDAFLLGPNIWACNTCGHRFNIDDPSEDAVWRPTSSWKKVSAWTDVMNDAKTIRDSGGVQILNRSIDPDSGQVHTIGQVASQSNPGEQYETEIWQDDPNSPAITLWSCDCEWGQKSWGRTRQWKKYEGRPCKHTLALYWAALGTPPDQGYQGQPQPEVPVQPAMGEGPKDWVQAPSTPGGPNFPTQPLDQPAEIQSDIAQQPTPVEQAFSLPQGPADGQSGTIHFPGALSSWKRSDYNGWTNYETWWVIVVIDNTEGYNKYVTKAIESGKWTSPDQLRDWTIHWIIGPTNNKSIQEAGEWNDLAPYEREELYPDALMDHEEDDMPHTIDAELVNWYEIFEHFKNDIEEERRHEQGLPATWNNPPDPDAPGDFKLPEGFSSWRKDSSFANGDIVRCKVDVTGIDRDDQTYTIPRNSAGEVLWSDDNLTIVIFPLRKNGPLQSHLVRVEDETNNFYLSPKFNPGPTRRR